MSRRYLLNTLRNLSTKSQVDPSWFGWVWAWNRVFLKSARAYQTRPVWGPEHCFFHGLCVWAPFCDPSFALVFHWSKELILVLLSQVDLGILNSRTCFSPIGVKSPPFGSSVLESSPVCSAVFWGSRCASRSSPEIPSHKLARGPLVSWTFASWGWFWDSDRKFRKKFEAPIHPHPPLVAVFGRSLLCVNCTRGFF